MYKGQPVEGATVSFWNDKAPRVASGVTDAQGKFQLSMMAANDGAMPGDNKITVSKIDPGAAPASTTPATPGDPAAMAQMYTERMQGGTIEGPKDLLPAKYSNQATTPLKETVKKEGQSTFVLQLTD